MKNYSLMSQKKKLPTMAKKNCSIQLNRMILKLNNTNLNIGKLRFQNHNFPQPKPLATIKTKTYEKINNPPMKEYKSLSILYIIIIPISNNVIPKNLVLFIFFYYLFSSAIKGNEFVYSLCDVKIGDFSAVAIFLLNVCQFVLVPI